MNNRKTLALTSTAAMLFILLASFMPAQSVIPSGTWRDINPTQYAVDVTGTLRGIYMRNGGTGAIGAGDGWAVGGDVSGPNPGPLAARYDGFSWQIVGVGTGAAEYNSAHFCTAPGAPGVGLCSPNSDGSDGWIVGTSGGAGAALYWGGSGFTSVTTGLTAVYGALNLTSVFMACHSPPFGTGCPSGTPFAGGLTFAVGSDGNRGVIFDFNGDPKAGGGWTRVFTSSLSDKFNSVYMYVDASNTLAGFAVGDGGVVARLASGSWTESVIQPGANDILGVFVDRGNPADAWAVGRSGEIWHFANGYWQGFLSPMGTQNDLVSVFLTSTSEGWIVGTQSVILHSTTLGGGNAWLGLTRPLQTGTGSGIDLLSVSFPGGSNGWSVGTQGVILHTENSNCGNAVPTPCWGGSTSITQSSQLNAVFEKSSNDAWAGGLYDTQSNTPALIHWDGNKWHRASVAGAYGVTTPNIWGIFMLGSSEGWAVGGNSGDTAPAALKWDGGTWTGRQIAPCACGLRSVYMISGGEGGDGWAVGTGGNIFRFQSGNWLLFTTVAGNPTLNGVFISNAGSSTNAGWAVGSGGTVLRLKIVGSIPTWDSIGPLLSVTQDLFGVYFTDSNHGWIVGAAGTILTTSDGGNSWSGGTGQVTGFSFPPGGPILRSVFIDNSGTGAGNGDGWAVGDDSTGNLVFAHWNGAIWNNVPLSPVPATSPIGLGLYSVYMTSSTDGFAVGTGIAGLLGTSLSGIFHLDPPNPPTQIVTTSTGATTSVISGSTSAGSVTATITSTTTGATNTVTSATGESTTGTETQETTGTSEGTQTTSVQSETSSASTSTPLELPAIPGFPWESIIAGMIAGLTVLGMARRHRHTKTQ